MVSISSRKSVFVPTKITGVDGQWCFTSGNHFPRTFSKDAGDTTKQFSVYVYIQIVKWGASSYKQT